MDGVNVNPDLVRARSQATFDPLKLTNFLYGGLEATRRKRFIQNIAVTEIEKEGFRKYSELSREEKYDQGLMKNIFYIEKCHELNLTNPDDQHTFGEVLFPSMTVPLGLHDIAFIPTINKLGTKEQKEKWLPLAENYQILGTYVQTELGHGSFLRGLETIATYDRKTKEFIIDTPSVTATKFWPGGLGKCVNHCLVMAKLYIDGRDCGMQSFMVQIRDIQTHKPLPGITVGDIGAKFNFSSTDNGFLKMNKVRIPRENMLMRYAQVLDDGTFIQPKDSRLIYGAMTGLRSGIAVSASWELAKAATIATRYSAVRIQSEINAGKGEVPVLDFQTQQYKLFTQIATAYAFVLSNKRAMILSRAATAQIESGNLEQLPLLHAVSSGLKAFCSWNTAHGIEQCRFACGGHGYLQASGLPKMYSNLAAACTYEGENTVLMLQTARFVNKCFEAGERGMNLPFGLSFLTKRAATSKLTEKLELEHLITAYEQRAAFMIQGANKRIKDSIGKGMKPAEAWNNASQALVEAAMAFCHAYVVRGFIETVQTTDFVPSLASVMTQLCQLYAGQGIIKDSGYFIKGGFMSVAQLDMVQAKVYDLLADLRPNAVALVDAFDFPDQVLDSALGRYDGNVYPALMESAYSSKLNQNEVHEGIFKYVKPFVNHLKQQKGVQARL